MELGKERYRIDYSVWNRACIEPKNEGFYFWDKLGTFVIVQFVHSSLDQQKNRQKMQNPTRKIIFKKGFDCYSLPTTQF